jgi:hypothetical protein
MISLSTGFPSGESSEKTPDLGRRFVDRAEEAGFAGLVRRGGGPWSWISMVAFGRISALS